MLGKSGLRRFCSAGRAVWGVMAKERADQMLVERGLAESRAKAQALILAGLAFSGERKVEKAGQALPADAPLEVRGKELPGFRGAGSSWRMRSSISDGR